MADDVEDIGGISVQIGASHARLPGDIAAADQLFESARARWQRPVILSAQAATAGPTAQAARSAPAGPSVVFGARAAAASQAQAAAPAFQRAVNEQLAKSGQVWNAVTGEIEDANTAVRKHKQVIVDVQQTAASPTELGIGFSDAQASALNLLNTMRAIVAEAAKLATIPAPKVAGAGGGGKRPKGRAPAAGGADDEEEGTQYPRIQYVDQIERQRRQTRESRGASSIEVNRSEQALTRQRQREEATNVRQRVRDEAAAARVRQQSNRQASAVSLQELSAQAQADSDAKGGDRGSTFAPEMTQARRVAVERERAEQAARADAQRARGTASAVDPGAAVRTRARVAAARVEERQVRAATRAEQRRDDEVFAQTAPDLAIRREREVEERVARARANITASGRTGRTAASGIGALFGGTQGRLIEANARLAASDKAVTEAERAALPFRKRIAEYDIDIANSSGRVATARTRAKEAFAADPKTVAALEKERKAIEGQRDALEGVNKLQSGGNVIRNLAAITAGGAAFGIGLKVADLVLTQVTKGVGELIEIQLGFGATSTRVTSALGEQTLALHGNVDAALAAATAQAGLSDASGQALANQLRLTTQIKAGAQAQQQASELFRAEFGIGNAPSGLFGSYGGVAGTGLFGQKGFTQQVQTDFAALTQGRGGGDFLGDFSRGLDYATNPGVRQSIDRLAIQQGQQTPLQSLANFTQFLPGSGGLTGLASLSAQQASQPVPFQEKTLTQEGEAYRNNLNDASKRGAEALGDVTVASYRLATSQEEVDAATRAAAAAGDQFGVTLAQQSGIVLTFGETVAGAGLAVAEAGAAYKKAAQQAVVGVGIADPAALARVNLANERQRQRESAASLDVIRSRQEFELPSIIAGIFRQQQFTANVQQPAQFALGALASPALPVGTGIAPGDRGSVSGDLREAQDLQDELNRENAKGRQIIQDTYRPAIVKNFGAAAAAAFDQALTVVETTGKRIAEISADMSNQQAAYQVAQYNFQLHIARRTLSDIAGLTGQSFGVEASRLGLLQRENLELSRQGQQLQFAMSQRQINFQTALAGFQAPGVTPEERQARVREAEIEASFAQKQLNIARQSFRNQVKIIDIGNLRQGRDLVQQIGLLQQGRQITINTAAAEAKLQRLSALQQRNVARVGTYTSAVETLVSTAFGHIGQLEAAAGKAMVNVATTILGQFGIFFAGLAEAMNNAGGRPGFSSTTGHEPGEGGGFGGHARGGVWGLGSPTRIGPSDMAGEAGDETLLILSRPRSVSSAGGGSTTIIQFNGNINVRDENDIDAIARKVTQAMGRTAAQKGLRGAY